MHFDHFDQCAENKQHEDGTSYDPKPDVMVLRQPLESGSLASVRIDRVGAPLFIAEIASDSTEANDQGDKRRAYAAIGVAEYLVVDPDGTLLPEPFMAWRLRDGAYVPWRPDADGWWHSTTLEVAFQPERPFVRVRDRDGVELARSSVVREREREWERQARELQRRLAAEERQRAALEEAETLAEQARQDAEARAAREEQARLAAEARMTSLEAQLRAALARDAGQEPGDDRADG